MILSYKFRLFTNASQESGLSDMLEAFCDLYNAGLQQRIEAYRRRGIGIHFGDQSAELKAVRASDDRLAGYSFSAEQQVLRRLDKAFSAFFGRIKRGGKAGFPRFRSKTRFDSADMRVGDGLTIRKNKRLGIVGIPGEIRVRWHRQIPADAQLGSAVICRKAGKWYICFHIKIASPDHLPRPFAPVGIDMGLTSLVAFSSGDKVPTPQFTKRSAKNLRKAQRSVSRKQRNSRRQRKAALRVAKLAARIANQRRDFSHKLSRKIVGAYSHIALEDLNINGLAAGMLAKSVHNAAWNQLAQHVTYKAESAGSVIVMVDPRGTSQTCPECGTVKRKALAERTHRCECGCVLDRDVAAAKIVLMRANFPDGMSGQAQSQRIAA